MLSVNQALDPIHFSQYVTLLRQSDGYAFTVSVYNKDQSINDEVILAAVINKNGDVEILTNDAHPTAKLEVAVHPMSKLAVKDQLTTE